MKISSIATALGLLIAVLPLLARDHSPEKKKLSIEGTYAGALSDKSTVVARFSADGTIILSNGGFSFFGTWKCIKHACYKFCAINENLLSGFAKFEGTFCISEDGETAHAENVKFETFEPTDTCLTKPTTEEFNVDLCRIHCK